MAAALLYMAGVLYISTRPLAAVSGISPAGETLNNLAHVPAYALLTLLLYLCLVFFGGGKASLAFAGLVSFFFGALMEFLQMWVPGRTASRRDIALNLAGVLCAAAAVKVYRLIRESPAFRESSEYV